MTVGNWSILFCDCILGSGWMKMETINSLIRKAGYNGIITESLRKSIQLTRYQSTLFTLQYSEYVSYVKETRGSPPAVEARLGNS